MKYWPAMIALGLLAGCARFQPQPLSPAETAAGLESRSLDNPGLKAFLEKNLSRELNPWPAAAWDFEMLTLAAFYYQPSLDIARAAWAEAQAGIVTAGARIETLSGPSADAEFLELSPSVDPQMQGQGFIFRLQPNSLRLTARESVAGCLRIPGEPLAGVIVPREAVVRTEGAGWTYVLNAAGDAFTRIQVALDHPTEAGWFVARGVTAGDYVVATGAQQLLSLELKFGDPVVMGRWGVLMTMSSQYGANTMEVTQLLEAAQDEMKPVW